MATNLKVSTDEAIAEIGRLIDEVKNLKTQFSGVGKSGKSGMKASADAINTMKANAQLLGEQMETLLKVVKENDSANKEVAKSAQKTGSAYKQLADQTKKASDSAKSMYIQHGKGSAEARKATAEYERLKKKLNEVDATQKKVKKSSSSMFSVLKNIASAAGFVGLITLLGQTAKSIVSLTIKFQSLGYAINKIAGDNFAEINRSWEFLIELNQNFGAKLSDTTERWLKFRAAASQSNLTLKDTMDIFRSVTKASAVLGLGTDELKGVYLALEQMLSKGKVTTEELRRQLGERLPGAMGIMAKAVGVSIHELDKMMKKGELLSSYALPRFAKALEEAYGIESLKTVENLATGVGKMAGAWDRFVLTISEGDSVLTKAIGGTMWLITKALDTLTNFLETYDQTANRTSGAKFGEEVAKELSNEIEDRLKNNEAIQKQIDLLEKVKNETKSQSEYDKAQVKINSLLSKQQEEYYKARVKDAELLLIGTVEDSKARKDAISEIQKAEQNLADFRKKKADEGNIYAMEVYKKELKKLEEIKVLRDAAVKNMAIQKPVIDPDAPTAVKIKIQQEYTNTLKETTAELNKQDDAYTKQLERVKQVNELLKPIGGTSFDEEETSGYKRRIKSAKKYAETNQLLINSLEEQIRLREKLTKDEKAGLVEQMDAMQYNLEARQMVIKLQEEDQIRALNVWRANESQKLKDNLESFKEGSAQYAQQAEQNRLQELENVEEYNEKLKLIHQDRRMKEKLMNEKHDDDIEENIVNRYAVQKQLLVTEQAEHLKVLEDKLKTIRKGGNEEKKILFEIRQIQIDYHNLMIDNNIKQLKDEANRVKTLGERLELLKKIRELEAQKLPDAGEDYDNKNSADGMGGSIIDPLFAQDFSLWAGKAQDFTNEIFGLADAIYEHRIALIQKEIDAEERKYDRLLELAKGDEEETKIIQRNKALALEKLEAKKRREQIKQAKLDKALRITQAIQSTAVAVMNALTVNPWFVGVGLAAIAAATGATQIATISTTPIPSFATGGVMEKDGKALINDGGNQEYVERGGSILTTGKTNALVDLKEGDIIHKDFETLQRKSLLLSLSSGGESITEKELNLAFGIKEEIQKGFKNAQVNSKVTVLNEQNNYRDKMSLWGNS